jgi:hypothetical protein
VSSTRSSITNNDHHYKFAAAQAPEPAGKKPGFRKPPTASHLIRLGQGVDNSLAMCREQIGVAFGGMLFSL